MNKFTVPLFASFVSLVPLQSASAVELLSATELASHCKFYPDDSNGVDGEFCARYIQGFIDGAITTDARVMLNVEADSKRGESFTERILRTRAPNRSDYSRAARYAEFCLGDPVPLKEVVINIVNDLNLRGDLSPAEAAREIVYTSLKKHYPCEPE